MCWTRGGPSPTAAREGGWPLGGAMLGCTAALCWSSTERRRRGCYARAHAEAHRQVAAQRSALLFVAYLLQRRAGAEFRAAMLAAVVIGLLNAVVRPVLVVLTLPVTVLTLGLFLFVINAITFWAAAAVLDGFRRPHFVAALVGSLLYTRIGVVIESALERLFAKK
jgi:putative membrane protein